MSQSTRKAIIFDGAYQELIAETEEALIPGEMEEDYEGDFEESGVVLEGAPSLTLRLARIEKWPETRTVFKVRKIFNGFKTKVPIVQFRECELILEAVITHPTAGEVRKDIEGCLKEAAAAGLVASLLTGGNLAAGSVTLQTYLVNCLAVRGVAQAQKTSAKLSRRKSCGKWGSPKL